MSGGKSIQGQSGQPNYQPTQATQGNPSVSMGFGMPPANGLDMPTNDGYSPLFADGQTPQQPTPVNGPATVQGLPSAGSGGGKGGMPNLGNVVGQVGNLSGQALNQAGFGPLGNIVGQVGDVSGQAINQIAQQPQPGLSQQDRYNQYANVVFGSGGNSIYQPNFGQPQPAPQGGIYGRDLSGNPTTTPLMGGMGSFTNVPAPAPVAQPVNRFAPTNAPGVRPRVAQTGIPAQQARRVGTPQAINQFTRTRTK